MSMFPSLTILFHPQTSHTSTITICYATLLALPSNLFSLKPVEHLPGIILNPIQSNCDLASFLSPGIHRSIAL